MDNTDTRSAGPAVQQRVGAALAALSLVGMLVAGAWLSADSFAGLAHWLGVALVQCVYASLIAYFLYSVLREKYAVSFALIFGILLTGSLAYHLPSAYADNLRRVVADKTILTLRRGSANFEDLSAEERGNPYVESYVVMRDVFRELSERADARVAPYRAAYAESVRAGAFLDPHRLDSEYDVWYSYAQLHQLEQGLDRIIENRVDVSDLLWTANSLAVDAGTRAAYANDLRKSATAIEAAQAASLERERETLARTKQSLEVLIDAGGRYRIDGAQIIFDDPSLSDRFGGKTN